MMPPSLSPPTPYSEAFLFSNKLRKYLIVMSFLFLILCTPFFSYKRKEKVAEFGGGVEKRGETLFMLIINNAFL